MATIDDVYNYIRDPAFGFPDIQARLNVINGLVTYGGTDGGIGKSYYNDWESIPGSRNMKDLLENVFDECYQRFATDLEATYRTKLTAIWDMVHANVDDGSH